MPTRIDPDLRRRLIELSADRLRWREAPVAYADAARTMFLYFARGLDGRSRGGREATVPTLIVHGALDRLVPVEAVRAAVLRHPELTLDVLDDIGHAPQLEAPEELVAVIDRWLSATT